MENSWCSSPKKFGSGIEDAGGSNYYYADDSREESWTEILADYSDYVRRLEEGERNEYQEEDEEIVGNFKNNDYVSHGGGDSLASDAGSSPKWRQMNSPNPLYNNTTCNNNSILHTAAASLLEGGKASPPNMPGKLNFKSKRNKEIPYDDDSLEDTASSPVNSPKITMGLKRMDLNTRMAEGNFDSDLGKGDDLQDYKHADDMQTEYSTRKINYSVEDCSRELQKKGLCLVSVSMLPSNMNCHFR